MPFNEELEHKPELLQYDPLARGWVIAIEIKGNPEEVLNKEFCKTIK